MTDQQLIRREALERALELSRQRGVVESAAAVTLDAELFYQSLVKREGKK